MSSCRLELHLTKLKEHLEAFSDELDRTVVYTKGAKERHVDEFCYQQQQRLASAERRITSIQQKMPSPRQRGQQRQLSTATELVNLIERLKDIQERQIARLEENLRLVVQEQEQEEPPPQESFRWTHHGPLHVVVEVDRETDGTRTVTPGSLVTPFSQQHFGDGFSSSIKKTVYHVEEEEELVEIQDCSDEQEEEVIEIEDANAEEIVHIEDCTNHAEERVLSVEDLSDEKEEELVHVEDCHAEEEEDFDEGDDSEEEEEATMISTVVAQRDDETYDDSALYCPTIIAARNPQQQRASHHLTSPVGRPRFTHIEVNNNMPFSPAATNITMDTSIGILNDSFTSALEPIQEKQRSAVDDCSVGSEETPVLDRYRIDYDPNSAHGFRVVPNPRRNHRRKQNSAMKVVEERRKKAHFAVPEKTTKTPKKPTTTTKTPSKRAYRKTPYKRAKDMVPATPTIDENRPLNDYDPLEEVPYRISTPTTTSPFLSEHQPRRRPRFLSTPSNLLYAQAHIASNPATEYILRSCITPVTPLEYECSPRVIQMQVSWLELDAATIALNEELEKHACSTLREFQAKRILSRIGMDDRKARTCLMSLCHWRRLILRRRSVGTVGESLIFEIP